MMCRHVSSSMLERPAIPFSEGQITVRRRNSRQDAIRDIVRTKSIRTQRGLVEELEDRGFHCTQATISRDIADMGLKKLSEGSYVLAEDLHLHRMVSEFVTRVDYANNLVIVKSHPGTAPGIGAAIDAAKLEESMGSVAGNDTVLVVASSEDDARIIVAHLEKLRRSRA